jgi:hypothetical protein
MPKFIKLQEGLNGGRYSDGKPGVFCYVNIDHIVAIEGYVGCCYIITTDHDYPIYISHEQLHEIVAHLETIEIKSTVGEHFLFQHRYRAEEREYTPPPVELP